MKNPEDPVRLEPRTPGLRDKHFTTEPRGTLNLICSGTNFVNQPFSKKAFVFMSLQHECFQNNMGKGDIAHREQFLLFPQCFLPF